MIQNNLKVAILEADEESEKVVEEFLQSKHTTVLIGHYTIQCSPFITHHIITQIWI